MNLETFDFEKLVLQGFLQLRKILRDLGSSRHKVSSMIPPIRQKNIEFHGILYRVFDGGWSQACTQQSVDLVD